MNTTSRFLAVEVLPVSSRQQTQPAVVINTGSERAEWLSLGCSSQALREFTDMPGASVPATIRRKAQPEGMK
jgi:hypothetical protein